MSPFSRLTFFTLILSPLGFASPPVFNAHETQATTAVFDCFPLRLPEPLPRHQHKGAIEKLAARTLKEEVSKRQCVPGTLTQVSLDPSLIVEEKQRGFGLGSQFAALLCCHALKPMESLWYSTE